MEIIAGVIELKPNSSERVEEWAKTINERIEEAVVTLMSSSSLGFICRLTGKIICFPICALTLLEKLKIRTNVPYFS